MAVKTITNNFNSIQGLGKVLGEAVGDFATTTAQQAIQGVMGHNANLASAQGQAAAAEFNASQANMANQQNIQAMANQFQFNAAQANMANEYSSQMWNQTAAFNEKMWEKQAAFNAEQAEIQRQWQERMSNTAYQRAMADMQSAGLNPILAANNGGAQVPGGAVATVGGASMTSAQGAMASGGLLGANSGSISGYQGQLEFTGGVLNLLATALGGISSAQEALSGLGDAGEKLGSELGDLLAPSKTYENENGETIHEYNGIGKFAESMKTNMDIATSPGKTWQEKKTNYYKARQNLVNGIRKAKNIYASKK